MTKSESGPPTIALESGFSVLSEIRSLTVEARSVGSEVQELDDQLALKQEVTAQLAKLQAKEAEVSKASKERTEFQAKLSQLTDRTSELMTREGVFARSLRLLGDWRSDISSIEGAAPELERWPEAAGGEDQLAEARRAVAQATGSIRQTHDLVDHAAAGLEELLSKTKSARIEIEQVSRRYRTKLEELEEGAGAVAREEATLRERLSQLEAVASLREQKLERLQKVRARRDELLSELESHRDILFGRRAQTAQELNQRLGPSIRIQVDRSAIHTDYQNAITAALSGSGLHHKLLSSQLAKSMSPRELGEAIENGDYELVAQAAEITTKRAARIVSHTQTIGVDGILTCQLEDGVRLQLLVGGEYRETAKLSTGQRCTVVLPILLSDHDRVVLVDQPEDHLDNTFVVGTVIKSLRQRGQRGQLVFATHNPNIPVLGEAARVIVLDSDGRRGYCKHVGELDDPESVDAITSVMEGGRDAFRRRAQFYGESAAE